MPRYKITQKAIYVENFYITAASEDEALIKLDSDSPEPEYTEYVSDLQDFPDRTIKELEEEEND
jgi:hypothetical protein